jgi:hypothetical protein
MAKLEYQWGRSRTLLTRATGDGVAISPVRWTRSLVQLAQRPRDETCPDWGIPLIYKKGNSPRYCLARAIPLFVAQNRRMMNSAKSSLRALESPDPITSGYNRRQFLARIFSTNVPTQTS